MYLNRNYSNTHDLTTVNNCITLMFLEMCLYYNQTISISLLGFD